MRRLKRVIRYTRERETFFLELVRLLEQMTEAVGWCDCSWADFEEKGRSTTGGILFLEEPAWHVGRESRDRQR